MSGQVRFGDLVAPAVLIVVLVLGALVLGNGSQYAGDVIAGEPTWLWMGY